MKLTQLFIEELDREADRTKRALEQVPKGKDDWKPHPKSMPLGRLAGLVASMPSWVSMIIDMPQIDIAPAGGGQYQQPSTDTLVAVHAGHVARAREALSKTTDDYLLTTKWKLLAGGKPVMETPRHIVMRDTFNHLAHHRGQLTVYLRLNDRTVPAIYGPSADDQKFT
ncbi:MAG TPA: DinB family protein [Vicinamibacterales bacterium]|nr:DinB family protein [Vicinamibacterales bacterium]